MRTRKATKARPNPPGWVVEESTTVNGRHLTQGTEVSIRGERGRFRFHRKVTNANGAEWLDFWGPNRSGARSFRADRVRTVHRIARTRENASAS